ncbi:MAG: thioesterase [Candidatus Krumholzibacteriia bacterium]
MSAADHEQTSGTTAGVSPDGLTLRELYRVTSWDADPRARLSPAALGRYLQETAVNHADRLGVGFQTLQREGLTWVVGGLLVRVHRYPVFQDEVVLETWPRTLSGLRGLRDFRLLSAAGEELAAASGAYFLMSLRSRRAVSLDRFEQHRPWRDDRALDRDTDKLPPMADHELEQHVPLRWSDIDLLGHVTNTRYLDLALETYEPGFLRSHEIAEMEVNFLAEAVYPDVVISRRIRASDSPLTFDHVLLRGQDRREVYRARLVWRPAGAAAR